MMLQIMKGLRDGPPGVVYLDQRMGAGEPLSLIEMMFLNLFDPFWPQKYFFVPFHVKMGWKSVQEGQKRRTGKGWFTTKSRSSRL